MVLTVNEAAHIRRLVKLMLTAEYVLANAQFFPERRNQLEADAVNAREAFAAYLSSLIVTEEGNPHG